MSSAIAVTPAARRSSGTVRLILIPSLAALSLLAAVSTLPSSIKPASDLGVQWVIYALWGWWALRSATALGLSREELLARPNDRRDWFFVLLVVPLLALSVSAMLLQGAILIKLLPAARAVLASGAADPPQPTTLAILGMLTGATVVPLVEELVFRGMLLRAWTARFGWRRALIGTSLLFGLLHQDLIGSVVFGVAMALLYRRTGSLLVSVITHATFNFVTGLAAVLPDGEGGATTEVPPGLLPATLVLLGCLLCVAAALRTRPNRRTSMVQPA